ncbi:MAG: flippase [Acidobacteria bacterium]|nr:flippase [Acidobacteriota bacterium]
MTPRNKSLVGNAARASGSIASTLLLAALLIVAGRILGDVEYGKFSFALAVAMIFEALVDFGLKEITTREVARERRAAHRIVADTFGLKLALAAVASMALLLAVHVLGAEPDERFACYLLGAASILRSYLLTIRHTLQGLERFGLDSTSVIIDRLLLFGLGSAALTGGFGLLGLAASFVFARMLSLSVACMLAASQVGRIRLAFDVTSWRALQLQALPFGAFAVVFYLYSYVDTIMLWALRSDAETGLYSAAYRLYEGLSSAPQVLHAVLIPRLASHFVRDRAAHARLSRTALSVSFVLAVPVCAGSILLANPLVGVFGTGYAAAGLPLQILGIGFAFVFPLFVLHAVALSVDAGSRLLQTAVIGCLANVAMNLVLIPRYGMHGAAAATVAGEALSAVLLGWGLRHRLWPAQAPPG